MPYLSASEVMIREEALYQLYVPLPYSPITDNRLTSDGVTEGSLSGVHQKHYHNYFRFFILLSISQRSLQVRLRVFQTSLKEKSSLILIGDLYRPDDLSIIYRHTISLQHK